ncbi:MAG: HAD family hydrolase [Patescibacteria group bacterium]
MTYNKALIFELDGVAIPKTKDAKPSSRVIDALAKAQESSHVLFATSRSWDSAKIYAKLLGIKAPCVTLGGSQVVDASTNKVLWEQELDPGVAAKIIEIAKEFNVKAYNYDTEKFVSAKSIKVKAIEPLVVLQIPEKLQPDIMKQIKKIPLLNVELSPALEKGFINITVKHIHATKFMALQTIAKKLKFEPKLSVGVGESASDITLLNFCGIKIAMGSAIARLKELAQHIAPGVKEDGLVWVIEKFVLG